MVASDGKIWFATDSGAVSFDARFGGSWARYQDSLKSYSYDSYGSQYVSMRVLAIAEAKDNSVWFGLQGGGTVRYNKYATTGTVWRRYSPMTDPEVVSYNINSIAPDKSNATVWGEVWFGSPVGISRYHQSNADDGIWYSYFENTTQLTTNVISTAATNTMNGHVWFGASDGEIVEAYYDINFQWSHYSEGGTGYKVNDIAFDQANNVWQAKDNGVSVLNLTSGLWRHFGRDSMERGLPGGVVNSVTTDFNSVRWFGTDSGLVRLNNSTWTKFTKENSPLPSDSVLAIKYDLRGNLWIGTQNGIAVFNEDGTKF